MRHLADVFCMTFPFWGGQSQVAAGHVLVVILLCCLGCLHPIWDCAAISFPGDMHFTWVKVVYQTNQGGFVLALYLFSGWRVNIHCGRYCWLTCKKSLYPKSSLRIRESRYMQFLNKPQHCSRGSLVIQVGRVPIWAHFWLWASSISVGLPAGLRTMQTCLYKGMMPSKLGYLIFVISSLTSLVMKNGENKSKFRAL